MAVKSKTQLAADIAASTFTAPQQVILDDMVDSYEDLAQPLTTVQIAAIATPTSGQLVYNTDLSQFQYYNGTAWVGLAFGLGVPQTVKVTIPSAQILAGNTTPVQLVAAQGSGLTAVPISFVEIYNYGTAAYATNTTQAIFYNGKAIATQFLAQISQLTLQQTANVSLSAAIVSPVIQDTIASNEPIMWGIQTGDPTAGDGTIEIYLTYIVINL